MTGTLARRWLLAIGWLALAQVTFQAAFGDAHAQNYPNRPIRLIVGYAAGGSVDIVCRIIADKLAQRLGQQVVVDNRPGGGTQVASSMLVKSEPDGYTLMMADIAHGANPALNAKLPYDTLKDFEPILLVAVFPSILAVDKSLPVASVKEFIALVKSKPGQLNYSSSGVGSMNFLASELLKAETGSEIIHIPYQSGAQATTALLGGFVQMLITTAPQLLQYVDKVHILAVSSDQRLPAIADVPTFAEQGFPNFKMQLWQGLLAPAGVDKQIVQKLNAEFNAVLTLPDVRERLATLGGNAVGGTPQAFDAFIRNEIDKWSRVIQPHMRPK